MTKIITLVDMQKTSEEWQKKYPEITVLDPDGWDRQNYQYSWFEELISFQEYCNRLSRSTCIGINHFPLKEKTHENKEK